MSNDRKFLIFLAVMLAAELFVSFGPYTHGDRFGCELHVSTTQPAR